MSQSFTPPNADLMRAWQAGDPINDAQLAEIAAFFASMVAGSEAMGATFQLATSALRYELDRARSFQHFRKST